MAAKSIIWYAIGLHLWQGALLLIDDAPKNVTSIHALTVLFDNRYALGLVLIVIGLLAVWGITREYGQQRTYVKLLAMMPQQLALLIAAFGALRAMQLSQFADGVVRPWTFIAADQFSIVLATFLHTLTMIEVFGGFDLWKVWRYRSRR